MAPGGGPTWPPISLPTRSPTAGRYASSIAGKWRATSPISTTSSPGRDFTYIDDIAAGTLAALDRPPTIGAGTGGAKCRVYNLGNHRPEKLLDFIAVLETALGRKAEKELLPMEPGDVASSFADIEASRRDLGYEPKTPIAIGLPRFVAWYRSYHGIA